MRKSNTKRFISFAIVMAAMSVVQAQTEKTGPKKMDRQERIQMQEKMAKLHTDMAACMKDEKNSLDSCQTQMMKNCGMGEMRCQMMGQMMGQMMSGDKSMKNHSMMGGDGMHKKTKK